MINQGSSWKWFVYKLKQVSNATNQFIFQVYRRFKKGKQTDRKIQEKLKKQV